MKSHDEGHIFRGANILPHNERVSRLTNTWQLAEGVAAREQQVNVPISKKKIYGLHSIIKGSFTKQLTLWRQEWVESIRLRILTPPPTAADPPHGPETPVSFPLALHFRGLKVKGEMESTGGRVLCLPRQLGKCQPSPSLWSGGDKQGA